MISSTHPNRTHYNWLIYNCMDRLLSSYSKHYRGVIYDLGAGESPYKNFFLKYADKYITVDWADSYHKTTVDIVADMNQSLPIESNVADTIVSLSVLEHLSEPQTMIKEAFRILKPGGVVILQVPWQWWIHEAPYDFFRFTPYGLNHLFQKAGFVEISVEPQAGFFTTMVLKWNYFTTRLIRGPKLVRRLIKLILLPFWYFDQMLAPILDKLDRDWAAESSGYYVVARKPENI